MTYQQLLLVTLCRHAHIRTHTETEGGIIQKQQQKNKQINKQETAKKKKVPLDIAKQPYFRGKNKQHALRFNWACSQCQMGQAGGTDAAMPVREFLRLVHN